MILTFPSGTATSWLDIAVSFQRDQGVQWYAQGLHLAGLITHPLTYFRMESECDRRFAPMLSQPLNSRRRLILDSCDVYRTSFCPKNTMYAIPSDDWFLRKPTFAIRLFYDVAFRMFPRYLLPKMIHQNRKLHELLGFYTEEARNTENIFRLFCERLSQFPRAAVAWRQLEDWLIRSQDERVIFDKSFPLREIVRYLTSRPSCVYNPFKLIDLFAGYIGEMEDERILQRWYCIRELESFYSHMQKLSELLNYRSFLTSEHLSLVYNQWEDSLFD